MQNGWITLHRKIKDHWLWEDKPFSKGQAWVDILLECNHAEIKTMFEGQLIVTKRGQSSNAKKTWAVRWGWSKSATRHFLNVLEKDGMINTQNARVTTLLTVLNYDGYQLAQTSERPQKDLAPTSEGLQKDPNNKSNNLNNAKNVKAIVALLNTATDRNFKDSSKSTTSKITARLNDGFTLEDFKAVIDYKAKQWKDDPKMADYLRPETLFGNKFEGYLQSSKNPVKEKGRISVYKNPGEDQYGAL